MFTILGEIVVGLVILCIIVFLFGFLLQGLVIIGIPMGIAYILTLFGMPIEFAIPIGVTIAFFLFYRNA